MFVDEIWLEVQGGRGGNGAVSFRREKYVPMGGPDGGNGGNGGSVYLWADSARHSFMDLRYRRHQRAEKGGPGEGGRRNGRRGEDLLIPVPLGTIVKNEQGVLLGDLTRAGQKVLVAAGGAGGRGNSSFASARRPAPRLAEKGLPGEERRINLELKLMAQVGLVGFPNAGKSTLLSRISAARPRVDSYPFTTTVPNLGVVDAVEGNSFVVADLPGLIEGAHQGAGLGHRFLRHVERNLLLLFVIDLSPTADPEPVEAYRQLVRELSFYNERLAAYPRVVAGNKMDLTGAEANLERLREAVAAREDHPPELFAISAATGSGIDRLVRSLAARVDKLAAAAPAGPAESEPETAALLNVEPEFSVSKEDGVFLVRGAAVEKLAAKTDFENEEALQRFQNFCRRSGLDAYLKKCGVVEGDTVRIGKEEFYYYQ
ncbi:MAG: GTPase ObgE [Bacillota bacterium]